MINKYCTHHFNHHNLYKKFMKDSYDNNISHDKSYNILPNSTYLIVCLLYKIFYKRVIFLKYYKNKNIYVFNTLYIINNLYNNKNKNIIDNEDYNDLKFNYTDDNNCTALYDIKCECDNCNDELHSFVLEYELNSCKKRHLRLLAEKHIAKKYNVPNLYLCKNKNNSIL
tara:strand:+ start:560 stop:1066 length:507 start_codon:yes stop_codon:yes gene_type:complete